MVGIVLSAQQIQSAPPAVREWIERQVTADFATQPHGSPYAEPIAAPAETAPLAACELPEVTQIFERLRHDPLASRLLLEFGREPSLTAEPTPLHVIKIAEAARNAGITSRDQFVASLNLINAVLQALRASPNAALFAFDETGHCYIHEVTHRALHLLWRDIVGPRETERAPASPITCDPPYHCVATPDGTTPTSR